MLRLLPFAFCLLPSAFSGSGFPNFSVKLTTSLNLGLAVIQPADEFVASKPRSLIAIFPRSFEV